MNESARLNSVCNSMTRVHRTMVNVQVDIQYSLELGAQPLDTNGDIVDVTKTLSLISTNGS